MRWRGVTTPRRPDADRPPWPSRCDGSSQARSANRREPATSTFQRARVPRALLPPVPPAILRHGWLSPDPATQTRFLVMAAAVGAHGVQSSISVLIINHGRPRMVPDWPNRGRLRGTAATQRSPRWPEPWHLLSEAANAQGEPDLARTAAARAVTADPMDRRGRYLTMEVEQDEDITALGALLLELRRLDPNGLDVHLDLRRYACLVEDPDLALTAAEVLEQVIEAEHSLWPEIESLRTG